MSGTIPDGVLDLIDLGHEPTDIRVSLGSCTFKVDGLELRFKLRTDAVWEFDEIVGEAWVHVEQMNPAAYWVGFGLRGGGRVCVDITKRGRGVRMTGWTEQ